MTHTAAIFDVHDDCDVRLNYVKKVLEDNGYETDIYLPLEFCSQLIQYHSFAA